MEDRLAGQINLNCSLPNYFKGRESLQYSLWWEWDWRKINNFKPKSKSSDAALPLSQCCQLLIWWSSKNNSCLCNTDIINICFATFFPLTTPTRYNHHSFPGMPVIRLANLLLRASLPGLELSFLTLSWISLFIHFWVFFAWRPLHELEKSVRFGICKINICNC